MSNIETTVIDTGSVEICFGEFHDDLLTVGAAGETLAGTILARDTVSGKFVPFVKGGATNGNGVPKAVMPYPVIAEGAGDVPVRPLIAGRVNENRLVIAADGDNSNVDAEVLDQLRDVSIIPLYVHQLGQ